MSLRLGDTAPDFTADSTQGKSRSCRQRAGHTATSQAGCSHGPGSYGRAAKTARFADQTPGCCAEAAGALQRPTGGCV